VERSRIGLVPTHLLVLNVVIDSSFPRTPLARAFLSACHAACKPMTRLKQLPCFRKRYMRYQVSFRRLGMIRTRDLFCGQKLENNTPCSTEHRIHPLYRNIVRISFFEAKQCKL
jgi:hypothetical protein